MAEIWKTRLRQALEERQMTMQALSRQLGRNEHYITQLLNRKEGGPNVNTLAPIASLLGIPITYLIDDDVDVSADAAAFAREFDALAEEDRETVRRMIRSLAKSSHNS